MQCPHCNHEIECPECKRKLLAQMKAAQETNKTYTKEKRRKAAKKAWKTKKKSL